LFYKHISLYRFCLGQQLGCMLSSLGRVYILACLLVQGRLPLNTNTIVEFSSQLSQISL